MPHCGPIQPYPFNEIHKLHIKNEEAFNVNVLFTSKSISLQSVLMKYALTLFLNLKKKGQPSRP